MPIKLNSSGGGSVTIDVPSTASNFTLTAPAGTGSIITTADTGTVTGTMMAASTVTPAKLSQPSMTQMTSQSTTSGTAITFSSIPSWVKRITVVFYGVSLTGTDRLLVRVGTGGSVSTTGYTSYTSEGQTSAAGFILGGATATDARYGIMTLINHSSNQWVHTSITNSSGSNVYQSWGYISLAGTLDTVGLAATGSNTFDAGSVNVLYE